MTATSTLLLLISPMISRQRCLIRCADQVDRHIFADTSHFLAGTSRTSHVLATSSSFSAANQEERHFTLPWRYKIVHTYPPFDDISDKYLADSKTHRDSFLPRVLCRLDSKSFPTTSQARKACQHRRVVIFRGDESIKADIRQEEELFDLGRGIIGESDTIVQSNDVVAIRTRLPDMFYPQYSTGFVDPPSDIVEMMPIDVIYEDNHIAVVNKPELLSTVGEKRNDLQSMLPFILQPPSDSKVTSLKVPRPVHRLDRRTSGCVVVAKTEEAMSRLSKMFASRQIQKRYVAIVFGTPRVDDAATAKEETVEIDGNTFYTVDYPIDGKNAVTLWRVVCTITSANWGTLSLLHLMPKTGRYHQIRRHLSYCLGCAIVGDTKYDGGGKTPRLARDMGMFLCSNSIEFVHELADANNNMIGKTPLPDKFYDIIGNMNSKEVI